MYVKQALCTASSKDSLCEEGNVAAFTTEHTLYNPLKNPRGRKGGGQAGGGGLGREGAKTQVVTKSASVPIVSVCQLLPTLVSACWL